MFAFTDLGQLDNGDGSDRIADFRRGEDRIELSGLNLAFQSGPTFSGDHQVRFDASQSMLLIEVTGDGRVDYAIEVAGVGALGASDLILDPSSSGGPPVLIREPSGRSAAW